MTSRSSTYLIKWTFTKKNVFDEWLDDSVKQEILEDLRERWQRETDGNAVFISATEKRNIEQLRKTILDKVREMYKVRYPYKTKFLF